MSNRLLGILVIFVIIILGFFYWVFIYVPNNIADNNDENQIVQNEEEIILIPIENNTEVEISEEITNIGEIEKNLTPQEKIENLKNNLSAYKSIILGNENFVFYKEDNFLTLKMNSKLVGTFDLVPQDTLSIKKIYSSFEDYFITNGNKYYIYNSSVETLDNIDVEINIDYIKKSNNNFLIKTNIGSFLYDKLNKSIEYQDILEDFVYYNDGYVGILKFSDERRIQNFGLEQSSDNRIIYYNPNTKEKEIVYTTSLNLTKIYEQADGIYFEENGENTYKLNNY